MNFLLKSLKTEIGKAFNRTTILSQSNPIEASTLPSSYKNEWSSKYLRLVEDLVSEPSRYISRTLGNIMDWKNNQTHKITELVTVQTLEGAFTDRMLE